MQTLFALALSLSGLALSAQTPGIEPTPAALSLQQSFAAIAKATWPSVVTVRAYVRKPAAAPATTPAAADAANANAAPQPAWLEADVPEYPGFAMVASGSGFFVDASGDVLTCNHVLQRRDGSLADLFDIELVDGSRVIAEAVGAEPTVNLAILHAMVFPNGHAATVTPLHFGDSDKMQPGFSTFGFGDPAGPEKFCASGTFIALPRRDCYQDLLSAFFLQTAMVVHPGAYGGPLLNLDGEVIGVLAPRQPMPGGNAEAPHLGIEMALPSKIVIGLYQSIRQMQSFKSPWLGFAVTSRAELAAERGLEAFQAMTKPRTGIMIENVWNVGPAAMAGIQPGDWLVAFGTQHIFTPVDFQKYLYLAGIGADVELEISRAGQTFRQHLVVQQRPADAAPR